MAQVKLSLRGGRSFGALGAPAFGRVEYVRSTRSDRSNLRANEGSWGPAGKFGEGGWTWTVLHCFGSEEV